MSMILVVLLDNGGDDNDDDYDDDNDDDIDESNMTKKKRKWKVMMSMILVVLLDNHGDDNDYYENNATREKKRRKTVMSMILVVLLDNGCGGDINMMQVVAVEMMKMSQTTVTTRKRKGMWMLTINQPHLFRICEPMSSDLDIVVTGRDIEGEVTLVINRGDDARLTQHDLDP